MGDNSRMKRVDALDALVTALRDGGDASFEALRNALTPQATFVSAVTGPTSGPDAVVAQLRTFRQAGRYARATSWHANGTNVTAELPIDSYYAAYTWDVALDAEGSVKQITQAGVQQSTALPPTPVRISPDLVEALRIARETRNPLILAYIDAAGRPSQAPRGTVQAFSETQLALWAHNPNGGLVTSIRHNPNVSLHYWGGMGTQYGGALSIQGVAHIEDGLETRRRIYDASPASEQRSDPQRQGCAVVIDVTSATGFVAGMRYNMSSDVKNAP
jgi:hypothetical protein